MTEDAVELRDIVKQFDTPEGGTVSAVDHVSLTIRDGEFFSLLGPSGCGKTTTLRLIAGFEVPTAGSIRIHNKEMSAVPPFKRPVNTVFQQYALFPHMNVEQNVGFGLEMKGVAKPERTRRVAEALALVRLMGMEMRKPKQLSGGQQQRVALARALAPRPFAVLLDEPFSNLDAHLRAQLRDEVRTILKETGTSAIFVTHDQQEALLLGDRVAVLNHGRLEQAGTSEAVFHAPRTRFVAAFFGRPDFVPATVSPRGLETELGLVPQLVALPAGAAVEVLVRPDDVAIAPSPGGRGVVKRRLFHGGSVTYCVQLPSGRTIHSHQPHTLRIDLGSRVDVIIEPGHALTCFHEGRAVASGAAVEAGAAASS